MLLPLPLPFAIWPIHPCQDVLGPRTWPRAAANRQFHSGSTCPCKPENHTSNSPWQNSHELPASMDGSHGLDQGSISVGIWPCAIPTVHLAELPAPLVEEELTSSRCGTASKLLALSFSSTEHGSLRLCCASGLMENSFHFWTPCFLFLLFFLIFFGNPFQLSLVIRHLLIPLLNELLPLSWIC